MSVNQKTHKNNIRVYYEDTDSGGVVYYANYLKFAERARTEFLRSFGVENKIMEDEHDVLFVVRHITADYFKSACLDDLLTVKTSIKMLKGASVVFEQKMYLGDDGVLLFNIDVTVACIDANSLKPTRFPQVVKQNFEKYII